ncbi:FliA/WhiG family RNA polymerase sigma factor [Photobacterium aphoticum]|nr:FliA/WhiG family RNA polymerase sigma factor [Photobacterium aphoticum]GHA59064.1 RNA polymerase sigma factor for flagellar operon [Photobacterium aphoticum]
MQGALNAYHHEGMMAYQQSQQVVDRARETRLIHAHTGLVRQVCRHMTAQVTTLLSLEDMEQIGLVALLDVIRRYPELDGEALIRLATQRIRGAVLDELRRMDWRSRRTRQRSHEMRDCERRLSRQLGRTPTEQELAQALAVPLQEVQQRRLDHEAEQLGSLETLQENGEQFFGLSFQCQRHERAALKRALVQALAQLSERDQQILCFYYEHEMNLKEIALAFEVTEARISQLHSKAIKTLHSLLADWRESV